MKGKNSFVLYTDLHETVKQLPDNKAGILFKTILSYVNDENPVVKDLVVKIAFEPIKLQLKRDLKKWEAYQQKQSENGKRGGRPKKDEPIEDNPENPTLILDNPDKPKKADTVPVTVIVTEIYSFNDFWEIYPVKQKKKDCQVMWKKLTDDEKLKIKETIYDFIIYKPFPDYNLPHPTTYLNQKRWEDELKIQLTTAKEVLYPDAD